MSNEIILFGINPFSKLAEFYLAKEGFKVTEYAVDRIHVERARNIEKEKNIVPFNEDLVKLKKSIFIPIMHNHFVKENDRIEKYTQAKSWGLKFVRCIHESSQISGDVGENCLIMENVVSQPFTNIGNNCILYPGVVVCHNSNIEDHCFIHHNVSIGSFSNVSGGSCLKAESSVASNTDYYS